jgi:NADH:ubiquinone oxidoreductase subunit 5 (subunit L)/multisubunit Na+/H+ antiporter MnhA subunit
MVAPTPVSGLLHAVAVVKSGVFGVARVVLDVYGPEAVADLGVGVALGAVAAFTLLAASVIALRKDNLKRRLAYSTVSQLSYIVLGLSILDPQALTGGLLHIPAHAFMKLTLFFCAGIVHVETHTDDISDMAGIGKRMPVTMAAFAVAAAGMAGIPLVAGFVSKFYLLVGTVSAGAYVYTLALLVSGVLNVAYFWPVVYQAYFESEDVHDAKPLVENPFGGATRSALARPDGGREGDGTDEGDGPDDEGVVDDAASTDAETDAEEAGGDEADVGPADDEDGDMDLPPEALGRPDFSGESVERDYSEPAPLVDGEYAVDRNSSDHVVDEGEETGTETGDADTDDQSAAGHDSPAREAHVYHDDSHDGHHHPGPPPGGWERRGWLGGESTWFMLGPILAAMAGSVVLGLVPYGAVFLRLIEQVVDAVLTAGVVG